jgi:hypothetical protein
MASTNSPVIVGAQGLTLSFNSVTYEITSMSFNKKVSEIDVSSLKTKNGAYRSYRAAPLRDGDELSVEYWGAGVPQMTATGTITFTFDGSGSNAALTAGLPTVALCTSSQMQAAAGELVKGSATFRMSEG